MNRLGPSSEETEVTAADGSLLFPQNSRRRFSSPRTCCSWIEPRLSFTSLYFTSVGHFKHSGKPIYVFIPSFRSFPDVICSQTWNESRCLPSANCWPVWPSGKQRDLGSNPLRLSFLFKCCGLWTVSCDFCPSQL